MSMFYYTMEFCNTTAHANADALSRLPLPVEPAIPQTPPQLVLLYLTHLFRLIKCTLKDPLLSQVVQYVQQGLPNHCPNPSVLNPFYETELPLYEGCLLWGSHVVIPTLFQSIILSELHAGYPGVLKGLARMHV